MLKDGQLELLPSPFIAGLLGQAVHFYAKDCLQIIGIRCLPWMVYDLLELPSVNGGVQGLIHPIAFLQNELNDLIIKEKVDEALSLLSARFVNIASAMLPTSTLSKAGDAMLKANGTLLISLVAAAAHATLRTTFQILFTFV